MKNLLLNLSLGVFATIYSLVLIIVFIVGSDLLCDVLYNMNSFLANLIVLIVGGGYIYTSCIIRVSSFIAMPFCLMSKRPKLLFIPRILLSVLIVYSLSNPWLDMPYRSFGNIILAILLNLVLFVMPFAFFGALNNIQIKSCMKNLGSNTLFYG